MSRLPATGLCKSSPCSDVECGKDLDSRSPRVPASLVLGDSMKPGTISRVWHRAGAPNDSPRTAELTTHAGLSATCPVSFTEPAQPVLWATLLYRCFNDLKTHSVIQPNALLSTYYVSQTLTGLRKIGPLGALAWRDQVALQAGAWLTGAAGSGHLLPLPWAGAAE